MWRAVWILLCGCCLGTTGACARAVLVRPSAPLAAASASGHPQQQVVYLKDGGAVYGTLVERNPHSGAVLRLQNNQERNIPNEQIAYIGLPGSGGLHIEAREPGDVSIDRVPMGHTPLDLANLEPGDHLLQINYDDGDSRTTHAAVYVGTVSNVTLPRAKLLEVGLLREGVKPVLGGSLFFGASLGDQYLLGGVGLAGGLNFGLGPLVDFRWLGHLQLGSVDAQLWFEVGTSASIRLNLSSVYAMEFGVRVALMPERDINYSMDGYNSSVRATFGVQGSLLSLRLGEQRSQELSLWHALQFSPASDKPAFQTGVSFMHVWL